jgi:hypothetical protein
MNKQEWKYYLPSVFKKKRVELGEGYIIAYVLFEWKPLFSIIVYNWKTILQNRFHSHAFAAIAFLLRGSYRESVFRAGVVTERTVSQWLTPRYLPRNYTHRILKAEPSTYTIVFTGPWLKHWYEWFEDTNTWVKYGWGRKVISKSKEAPKEL